MKKLPLIICTAFSMAAFGQKVSDYKYISLPATFDSFKGEYGLGELLTKTLRSKNYAVIPTDKLQWPADAKDNPCNVLMGDIINDSGFLRNKVVVQFKDCNDKIISSSKGGSNIKDYKEGYQDALKQTYASISPASPVAQTQPRPQNTALQTQSSGSQPVAANSPASDSSPAMKFSNGKADFQKVQMDDSQFILVGTNSSSPYATFKATTKKDVFRVKLQNGENTLGYYENGNIVVEIPQGDGNYGKEVFTGK